MCITGTPSLPAPTFLPHINLAHNCPGPADDLQRLAPLRRRPGQSTGQLHPFTPSTILNRIKAEMIALLYTVNVSSNHQTSENSESAACTLRSDYSYSNCL